MGSSKEFISIENGGDAGERIIIPFRRKSKVTFYMYFFITIFIATWLCLVSYFQFGAKPGWKKGSVMY